VRVARCCTGDGWWMVMIWWMVVVMDGGGVQNWSSMAALSVPRVRRSRLHRVAVCSTKDRYITTTR